MKAQTLQQAALLVGFLAAGFLARDLRPDTGSSAPAEAALEASREPSGAFDRSAALAFSDALVEISDRAAASVVQVRTLARRSSRSTRLRTLQEGSGFLVRDDGVLVTNNHVVKGGSEYRVLLPAGVRRKAILLARDPEADLAVLRIQPEEGDQFEALTLDGPAPAVGQVVMALGSPLGLGHSVTSGIVCGLGRSDLDIAIYEDFIQTDCVVNPGSSGGPLIDLHGRVVGITTAMGLKSNGDDGISFAIPTSMVRKVVGDILEHGRVVRGWIGIEPEWWFDPEREEGYDGVSQVKVRGFPDDAPSPAKEAGLQVGDIVIALDDRRLVTRKDLMTAVAECAPQQSIEVQVWRKGELKTFSVTLAEREPAED